MNLRNILLHADGIYLLELLCKPSLDSPKPDNLGRWAAITSVSKYQTYSMHFSLSETYFKLTDLCDQADHCSKTNEEKSLRHHTGVITI